MVALNQGIQIGTLRNTFDEVRQRLIAETSSWKVKHRKTKQDLEREQAYRRQIEQELEVLKQSQPPSKPAGASVSKQVKAYREKTFEPARSGNGWTRSTAVEGWFVTWWVGRRRGRDYACVFQPNRGPIEATEEPLIDQPCDSEDAAFKRLLDGEQSG